MLSRLPQTKRDGINISFLCNYQQATGATVAIASIANQLSYRHNVGAHIKPLSGYTRLLSLRVRQYFSISSLTGPVVFVDIEQENTTVEHLLDQNKLVILTCHAFPTILHSVPQEKLIRNLELCTHIHFVSAYQRAEFIRYYPEIVIEAKSFIVPNHTRESRKETVTNNIGIVGHLNREPKNALQGVKLAQRSSAHRIECWGSDSIHGLDDSRLYTKLRINGWSDNLRKMHNSFDVLLNTSRSETFGLVVVEALSAGIPCVLSDIPVYRELYSGCKGVAFLTGDEQQDIQTINHFLDQAKSLKPHIIEFWNDQFSNETIRSAWLDKIVQLTK
jgi:glycosyltransferase involved in cell wall biosynthesis